MAHEEPLPPGQYVPRSWPVLHYGPVPRFRPERWDLLVHGATAEAANAGGPGPRSRR
jgi:hypothetical protein